MPDSGLDAADQAVSEETESALRRHLLGRAPTGHELTVLRRWRAELQAQRSAGDAKVIDSDGHSWRLDDALFVAFDCLEREWA